MLRLPPHRPLPVEPEPGEILVDRPFEFGCTAGDVYVFHAQQQAPAECGRHIGIEQGRQRMAEMQEAVRARRETQGRV
jgi:hypothetical protein